MGVCDEELYLLFKKYVCLDEHFVITESVKLLALSVKKLSDSETLQ